MIRSIQNFLHLFPSYCISFRDAAYFIGRWLITPLSFIERLLPKEGTIVDIGCGEGMLANLIAIGSSRRRVIGFDLDKKRIAVAEEAAKKRITNVKFSVSDALNYNFDGITGVTLIDVLHHIPDPKKQEKIIRIISDKSNKGTMLIVREPCFNQVLKGRFTYLVDKLLYRGDIINFRKAEEWKILLEGNNFSVTIYNTNRLSPISSYVFVAQKQ